MTELHSNTDFRWDAPELVTLVRAALEEDHGACDLTTESIVPPGCRACAHVIAKQDLVLAGLPLVTLLFRTLDPHCRAEAFHEEGSLVHSGEELARIESQAHIILFGERTAMNFLAHLCGVATLTREFADAIAGTRARMRDTRKTTPLLRGLEKYAVRMGGGTNHRFGLYDAILIKENHIAIAGGIAAALHRAQSFAAALDRTSREMTAYESFVPRRRQGAGVSVQIEVRDENELRQALGAGADSVLLDNVTPAEAARLTAIARQDRPNCVIEVSGGITLANIRAYGEAGVDFISVGALTHSAPAADLSLLVEPRGNE
jgi:nicotinate-nucleotide pyrophosphorylase (carboxylating)